MDHLFNTAAGMTLPSRRAVAEFYEPDLEPLAPGLGALLAVGILALMAIGVWWFLRVQSRRMDRSRQGFEQLTDGLRRAIAVERQRAADATEALSALAPNDEAGRWFRAVGMKAASLVDAACSRAAAFVQRRDLTTGDGRGSPMADELLLRGWEELGPWRSTARGLASLTQLLKHCEDAAAPLGLIEGLYALEAEALRKQAGRLSALRTDERRVAACETMLQAASDMDAAISASEAARGSSVATPTAGAAVLTALGTLAQARLRLADALALGMRSLEKTHAVSANLDQWSTWLSTCRAAPVDDPLERVCGLSLFPSALLWQAQLPAKGNRLAPRHGPVALGYGLLPDGSPVVLRYRTKRRGSSDSFDTADWQRKLNGGWISPSGPHVWVPVRP